MNKQHTCRNCAHFGHLYKDCPHPITSFGIICYRKNAENKNEYLMIQRKDSLCFMEFIRGKYDLKNSGYIRNLLSGMTIQERELLVEKQFDELWNYVWYQTTMMRQTNEYSNAKVKFDTLNNSAQKMSLKFLLETSISPYENPEWGFPKGRRKVHEDDVKCAQREFTEETSIPATSIIILSEIPPFEEIFYGTNNILYRHVYYIAKLHSDEVNPEKSIEVDPTNINQAREVRAIMWLEFHEVLGNIREHNLERKKLIEEVHHRLYKDKND